MVGVLRSVYDRKTGKCLSREIVEELDITEADYFKTIIEVEGDCILKKLAEKRKVVWFTYISNTNKK